MITGLTLLFIGLKLTGFIDWSWVLVLSPALVEWTVAAVITGFYLRSKGFLR